MIREEAGLGLGLEHRAPGQLGRLSGACGYEYPNFKHATTDTLMGFHFDYYEIPCLPMFLNALYY